MRQKIYIGTVEEINFYFWGDIDASLSPLSAYASLLLGIPTMYSKQILSFLNGFEINLLDCKKNFAKCRPERKQIFISALMLEFLWLSIYVNYNLSKVATSRDNIEIQRDVFLSTDVIEATLRCKEIAQGYVKPWPFNYLPLPKLDYNILKDQPSDFASEISLYCLHFIILHELAHWFMYTYGDGRYEQEALSEIIADEFALSHSLDKESFCQSTFLLVFKKRMLAIIEVCSMFVFIDQIRYRNHSTHPSGICRLRNILDSSKETYIEFKRNGYVLEDTELVFESIYQHASFTLYFYSQKIFGKHCNEVKTMRDKLLGQSYDTPKVLFNHLIDLYREADRNRMRVVRLHD